MDALSKPQVTVTEPIAPPSSPAPPPAAKTGQKESIDMYMTYSLDHDIPFVADYYGIGNMLNYKDLSYKAEVDSIDDYLMDEVKGKRLENSTEAVKARLKQLEKIAGIDPLTSTSLRVQKLAAYSEYLKKMSAIDQSVIF